MLGTAVSLKFLCEDDSVSGLIFQSLNTLLRHYNFQHHVSVTAIGSAGSVVGLWEYLFAYMYNISTVAMAQL